MRRRIRLGLVFSPTEKRTLVRLAEADAGLTQAAVVRRLIQFEARRRSLWQPDSHSEVQTQAAPEVRDNG